MKLKFSVENQIDGNTKPVTTVQPGSQGGSVQYDDTDGNKPELIVMSGPLGNAYTQALGVYFAKKPIDEPSDGGVVEAAAGAGQRPNETPAGGDTPAAETQATDVQMQTALLDVADLRAAQDSLVKHGPRLTLLSPYDDFDVAPDASVFVVDNTAVKQAQTVSIVQAAKSQANKAGRDFAIMVTTVDAAGNVNAEATLTPAFNNDKSIVNADNKFEEVTSTDLVDQRDEDYIAIERLYEGTTILRGVAGFAQWLDKRYA